MFSLGNRFMKNVGTNYLYSEHSIGKFFKKLLKIYYLNLTCFCCCSSLLKSINLKRERGIKKSMTDQFYMKL